MSEMMMTTKVIETGATQKLGCGYQFAFYSNYGRICSCFFLQIFSVKEWRNKKSRLGVVQGDWK